PGRGAPSPVLRARLGRVSCRDADGDRARDSLAPPELRGREAARRARRAGRDPTGERTGAVAKYLILAVLLVAGPVQAWPSGAVRHPGGVLAPREPTQTAVKDVAPIALRGFRLVPLARYEIEARVLSTERYWLWREASLSPVDWAVGWGPMSD